MSSTTAVLEEPTFGVRRVRESEIVVPPLGNASGGSDEIIIAAARTEQAELFDANRNLA